MLAESDDNEDRTESSFDCSEQNRRLRMAVLLSEILGYRDANEICHLQSGKRVVDGIDPMTTDDMINEILEQFTDDQLEDATVYSDEQWRERKSEQEERKERATAAALERIQCFLLIHPPGQFQTSQDILNALNKKEFESLIGNERHLVEALLDVIVSGCEDSTGIHVQLSRLIPSLLLSKNPRMATAALLFVNANRVIMSQVYYLLDQESEQRMKVQANRTRSRIHFLSKTGKDPYSLCTADDVGDAIATVTMDLPQPDRSNLSKCLYLDYLAAIPDVLTEEIITDVCIELWLLFRNDEDIRSRLRKKMLASEFHEEDGTWVKNPEQ